jgi:dTMP kinase
MKLFITFEGGEGCGKSLQSKHLYHRLNKLVLPALLIHEPGDISVSALSELMLFNASRSQLASDVILPALKEEKIVICDRFSDSTLAYQSFARGLDFKTVQQINDIACQGLKPDIIFLLDVPPEIGLARKKAGANDRFEQEDMDFHQRVREGFLKLAKQNHRRWVIIDATLPPKRIGQIIWNRVSREMKKA